MTFEAAKELTKFLLDAPKRIHLIGVAGSGMSGIAGLLIALGHRVSGCDRVSTLETRRLEMLGLKFFFAANEGNGLGSRTGSFFLSDQIRKPGV